MWVPEASVPSRILFLSFLLSLGLRILLNQSLCLELLGL